MVIHRAEFSMMVVQWLLFLGTLDLVKFVVSCRFLVSVEPLSLLKINFSFYSNVANVVVVGEYFIIFEVCYKWCFGCRTHPLAG